MASVMPYIPVAVLLAAGFAVGRFLRIDTSAIATLLHYVLIPVYIFQALLGSIKQHQMYYIVGLGAALAIAGVLILNVTRQKLNQGIDDTAAVSNIVLFTMPALTIAWNINSSRQMALAMLFIGMAVAHIFWRDRAQGFMALVRQPWLYGVAAAVLVQYRVIPKSTLLHATEPIGKATIAVALFYLGCHLSAAGGLGRKDIWISIGARLGIGLGVAIIAFKLFPIPGYLRTTLIAGAMGPPATLGVAMMCRSGHGDDSSDSQIIAVGVLATLVLYILFPSFIHRLL